MPTNLIAATQRFGPPQRREWVTELPRIVREVSDRWELALGEPYQPGGQCSWVAPARDRAGRDLVLKVGWTHEDNRDEAAGLRRWGGNGAITVFDELVNGPTTALLLERCDPGTTLATACPEDEQDEVVAAVLIRLWQAPTDGPFRPLDEMCATWADEFEAELAVASTDGPDRYDLDRGIVRAGVELYRSLARSATRTVLLATDLHAENILAARRQPWLAIDPKPYLGDPTFDALQHLLNRELAPDPLAAVNRMAELLELDPQRLTAWLFGRCVIESIWMPQIRWVATALSARI
jgi:streptomycin 6-kinase